MVDWCLKGYASFADVAFIVSSAIHPVEIAAGCSKLGRPPEVDQLVSAP